MTDATHLIHLLISDVAEKHGVDYDIDTESRKILINFIKSIKFMGNEGIEMLILAYLVGYEGGAKRHYLRQGT